MSTNKTRNITLLTSASAGTTQTVATANAGWQVSVTPGALTAVTVPTSERYGPAWLRATRDHLRSTGHRAYIEL